MIIAEMPCALRAPADGWLGYKLIETRKATHYSRAAVRPGLGLSFRSASQSKIECPSITKGTQRLAQSFLLKQKSRVCGLVAFLGMMLTVSDPFGARAAWIWFFESELSAFSRCRSL